MGIIGTTEYKSIVLVFTRQVDVAFWIPLRPKSSTLSNLFEPTAGPGCAGVDVAFLVDIPLRGRIPLNSVTPGIKIASISTRFLRFCIVHSNHRHIASILVPAEPVEVCVCFATSGQVQFFLRQAHCCTGIASPPISTIVSSVCVCVCVIDLQ